MKKFLLLFSLLSTLCLGQNIWFTEPTSSHIDYIGPSGEGPIAYHMTCANGWVIEWYQAKLTHPDGTETLWMNGQSGGWWVSKAGTYQIRGQAYGHWVGGWSGMQYANQFSFSVVDNYSPSVPQNFDVTIHSTGNQSYPKLTWNLNTEYDGDAYYIERRKEGQQNFSFLTAVDWNVNQYIDYTIAYAGSGPYIVEYKMRAHDINSHYSNYTGVESVDYGFVWKSGNSNNDILMDYKLEQNYPNPYNPSTTINYLIKEKGFVLLKVYDLLGNEKATLVNNYQEPGEYSVNFNGSELSSGVYIYSLRVNDFIENMKMTLIK